MFVGEEHQQRRENGVADPKYNLSSHIADVRQQTSRTAGAQADACANREYDMIEAVTAHEVKNAAEKVLRVENSSVMYYVAE